MRAMARKTLQSLFAAALLGLAGCGTGGGAGTTETEPPAERPPAERPEPPRPAPLPRVEPARCPAEVPGCRVATGRIVYVERVDPDGDGDAHFVIADRQGITLPGLTAIDVRAGLRPRPLPGPGEEISAAGPVQTGSYGQSQIHALELRVAER